MDPNETLRELRELATYAVNNTLSSDEETRLGELVQSLDEWLSRGGYPPKAWRLSSNG